MTSGGTTTATKELLLLCILIRTMTHRCVLFVKFTKLHIYDLCMLYNCYISILNVYICHVYLNMNLIMALSC